jgi:hypothetical protein
MAAGPEYSFITLEPVAPTGRNDRSIPAATGKHFPYFEEC